MNRPRSLVIGLNFALLLVATAMCFEIGARVFGPQLLPPDQSKDVAPGESLPGEPNLIGDSLLGWRVKSGRNRQFGVPEETYVNRLGLRNPELEDKPLGLTRLLIVGDSSIYGVRVRDSENISGQLGQILQQKGHSVEVLNGGCPGYSTWQVIRLLESRLLDTKPDWLIIGALWSDTQGADAPDATRFGGQAMPLRYYSRAFILLQNWLNKRKWGVQEVRPPTNDPNADPKNGPHEGPPDGPEKVAFGLQPVIAPTNRVPLSSYRKNLEHIVELAEKNNIRIAFLVLPGIRDLVDGTTGDFREAYREVMRDVASQKDYPIADMPSQFVGGDERHLFFDDVHPKTPGYKIIATELANQIDSQGL